MNKLRGESKITLGGSDYALLPSHQALAAIETRLDLGIIQVVNRLLRFDARTTDIAVIVEEGIRAAGGKVPEDLPGLLQEHGIVSAYKIVSDFLTAALQDDTQKQAKAATA